MTSTISFPASRIALLLTALVIALAAGASSPRAQAASERATASVCVSTPSTTSAAMRYRSCVNYTGPSTATHADAFYSRVATRLIGRSAIVVCWSQAAWNWFVARKIIGADQAGFVWGGQQVINLRIDVCQTMDQIAYYRRLPAVNTGTAYLINTFTHEAMHAHGQADEAVAECWSMQLNFRTTEYLGAGRQYGQDLTAWRWFEYRDLGARTPAYWSADCFDGGRLDMYPNTSLWP